ncbi:reverse transcriptase domain-containing protein [Mesorhizobium australicum]|uniref:reverse transcriptase domain-containing protein n=1 Tax=Mesorhizobium australicum TaxID=536018 RepID=UPI00333C4480
MRPHITLQIPTICRTAFRSKTGRNHWNTQSTSRTLRTLPSLAAIAASSIALPLSQRYADDAIVHCRTEGEAQIVVEAIRGRLAECRLELHPEKTRMVYCKDSNRGEA